MILGLGADSRDDVFNPRHGVNASLSDEVSGHEFGSDFNYQLITADAARFFPVGKNQTFAIHGRAGAVDRRDPDQQALHVLRPGAARVFRPVLRNR